MRISSLLVVSCACCALLGCSSVNTLHSAPAEPQKTIHTASASSMPLTKKDPMEISFYTSGKNPNNPYTVLGVAKISRTNKEGIKRQDAVIHDAMRSVAASMGGDAVIEVNRNNKSVIGKVIAYQSKEHSQQIV